MSHGSNSTVKLSIIDVIHHANINHKLNDTSITDVTESKGEAPEKYVYVHTYTIK